VQLLEERELTVSELVAAVGQPQPRVSTHLACLRHCGFVTTGRRFWTWCAYDILGILGALKASGSALSPARAAGRSRFSSTAAIR